MAEEEQQRKRGRRSRGRGRGRPKGNDGQPSPGSGVTEPGAPLGGVAPSTAPTSREGEHETREHATGSTRRARRAPTAGGNPADVNPMDFWRSGRARSVRTQQALPGGKKRGILDSIRHMYFPPWVPVAVIIVAVFGILGLLFVTRSATGAPHISDHWHASYSWYVCGEKQPNAPTWEGVGVHTHGDGIFHIHPFTTSEEGSGARMVKWFEYGGGELTQDSIKMPGFSKKWSNGDTCPDTSPEAGQPGVLQVFVNGAKMDNWTRYIPHDGDQVKLIFGKADSIIQLDDHQVIGDSPTRHISMDITGDATTTTFTPSAPTVKAGEVVQIDVHNKATVSHQFRILGVDGKPNTADDFVAVPVGADPKTPGQSVILQPNTDGFVVVRFDEAGQITFEDPISDTGSITTGTLIVEGVAAGASPTTAPGAAEVTGAMTLTDTGYDPASLTLTGAADKTFGITLTNTGKLVHNLQIAGPDGQYNTDDDITSEDVPTLAVTPAPSPSPTAAPAGTGSPTVAPTPAATPVPVNVVVVTGKLPAGTYQYRDSFPSGITGTIVIN